MPKTSAMTEWSMTSSAGASGLIFCGSPPRSAMASRMVARSTMQGTPVKSCMITRAGVNWISWSGSAVRVPVRERADVVGGDVRAVLGAQQVLQQDLQAEGQLLGALHRVEPVDVVVGAVDGERRPCSEAVLAGCHCSAPTPRWFVALRRPPPIIPVQPRAHRVGRRTVLTRDVDHDRPGARRPVLTWAA